ncbi:tRNA lysidine(34) synthetase TilS [Jannaschia seohaensis]|uniref:tRNA(Ile)-lysidine synthase n=1 Tax=Jannaschia seohaensis TaxID=475081 RepID=A0A2Y9C414_9RHOB|nr:tRNA lysidine(34) synthetase TilS [Jannaschia seohaensis]PWJ22515.1 tRNA(Ile)-lysidine synthase [Jannaschia seohaensis]SSA38793.1 tRNA(Ile)-lysidine synthase [Jannaschia seohaensis]
MAAPELDLDAQGGPYGVAVSGGADSLALLLASHAQGLAARAVTVDHGLRPEAAAEAAQVARICAARGIPHETRRLDLSDGPALQARARDARYRALGAWARTHGLRAVLLGHTADDVAEGFVMRLADGAGLDGLAAMTPRLERDGAVFLRPLLSVSRRALRDWVEAQGLVPVDDPSNADPRFERVRARHLIAGLGIDPVQIAASATALRMARNALERRAREIVAEHVTFDWGDWLIPRETMDALLRDDPEHARRLLLAALAEIGGASHPPRRAKQEELLRRAAAARQTTLAGCLLTWTSDRLRVSREPAEAAAAPPAPLGALWDGRWRVTAQTETPPDAHVAALGEAVSDFPWRESGLPRQSLLASPAIWSESRPIAAPLAHPEPGWTVECLRRRGS